MENTLTIFELKVRTLEAKIKWICRYESDMLRGRKRLP